MLLLILILATTFLDTSVQLFIQSIQSAKIIEENTTTLAIEQIVYEMQEVNGIKTPVPVVLGNEVMDQAKKSSAVISLNETNTLCARGEGLMPVYPSNEANAQGALDQLSTENIAVFHVLYESGLPMAEWGDKDGGLYRLEMKVIEALSIHPDARVPEYIDVRHAYINNLDTIPFEKGKEYVIIGHYLGVNMFRGHSKVGKALYRPNIDDNPIFMLGISEIQSGIQKLNQCETVMAADDPRVENLLNISRQNNEMFLVTGVDQIEGIPLFAMNEAFITKGRAYTREETQSGARVCLVSSSFAEENKLQVGDAVNLQMHRHTIISNTMNGGRFYQMLDLNTVLNPVQEDEFTIIGIYRTKEWGLNKFCFPPSTVFVPNSSLTAQGKSGIDYADALILQNGSNEQFMQDVEDAGIRKGVYTVYDGGYMQFMDSLKTMQKDTALVMLICFLLYLVVDFAALSLMVLHLKKDAETMLKIGASIKYVDKYIAYCVLPVTLLAAICAYAVGCVIHVPLMELIEKWYVLSRPVYSNLVSNAQGMLTANMDALHLPIGTSIAWVLSVLMTCTIMIILHGERRMG
ncbi:MAG: hypothetical protein E7326_06720 [Clostridiales bacterium]|nr:hypothetical protein [Clostridiales bacterium]